MNQYTPGTPLGDKTSWKKRVSGWESYLKLWRDSAHSAARTEHLKMIQESGFGHNKEEKFLKSFKVNWRSEKQFPHLEKKILFESTQLKIKDEQQF